MHPQTRAQTDSAARTSRLVTVLLCALCAFVLPALGCAAKSGVVIPTPCIQRIRFLHPCEPVAVDRCQVKTEITFTCIAPAKPVKPDEVKP